MRQKNELGVVNTSDVLDGRIDRNDVYLTYCQLRSAIGIQ